ncbi:MAG: nitronate monooxygenase [Bacteroidales bacterium]|nr:nitronate monooxygenase [Bacteroidales bacterium]MBQ8223021.1 nitronate monooxygenase [Bacteroidales bacterium]
MEKIDNRVTRLFGIRYPIISGGMVWCSGAKLAAAVTNAGGLGLIGAGSLKPDMLREHIAKCRELTKEPFGVNVPLMSPYSKDLMEVIIEEKVPIVFTSAGNPQLWTEILHDNGIKVAHVVSSSKFALKAQQAGVDAVVAEGFEAGGHNGREETTTMVLIPAVKKVLDIPLIAAGGIATGDAMLACLALGAEGVQVGSRFAVCSESSASPEFKTLCTTLKEGDTMLSLKKISPTRLVKNKFFEQVDAAEQSGATKEELQEILGRGKAQQGIFLGDVENGELEIGQVAAIIRDIPTAKKIVDNMISELEQAYKENLKILGIF